MPSDRKPSLILPVAATLAVLLGPYVGAYYATVEPTSMFLTDTSRPAFIDQHHPRLHGEPLTRTNWDAFWRWRCFFAPIHWLDCRIRPHVWEPGP